MGPWRALDSPARLHKHRYRTVHDSIHSIIALSRGVYWRKRCPVIGPGVAGRSRVDVERPSRRCARRHCLQVRSGRFQPRLAITTVNGISRLRLCTAIRKVT
jgi:hypothetical protein